MLNLVDAVRRFRAGDQQQAFRLFETYQENIRRYTLKYAHTDDVEDVLSEVCLTFQSRLSDLRNPDQVKNFLFQLTRDEIRRHWSNRNKHVAVEEYSGTPKTSEEQHQLAQERVAVLRVCIDEIEDEKTRRVGTLRFRNDLSLQSISEQTDLSLDQVKRRIKAVKIAVTDCVRAKFRLFNA